MNMLYNAYQENIDCQKDNKRDQTVRNKKSLYFFYFFYSFFVKVLWIGKRRTNLGIIHNKKSVILDLSASKCLLLLPNQVIYDSQQ